VEELWEEPEWEAVGVGGTREEKMGKWLSQNGARGVGMVESVEKTGPGVEPGRPGGRGRVAGPPPGWGGT
jgi:hypothetical protein